MSDDFEIVRDGLRDRGATALLHDPEPMEALDRIEARLREAEYQKTYSQQAFEEHTARIAELEQENERLRAEYGKLLAERDKLYNARRDAEDEVERLRESVGGYFQWVKDLRAKISR